VVLVDTSVWIEVFRKSSRLDLESLVAFDDIVTCLPVVQEVLQGFDSQPAFTRAREAMLAFPVVESPLTVEVYEQAIELYRSGRRLGLTIGSSVDCLIGACAIRHQLEVLHCDRGFDALARGAPLRSRNVGKSAKGTKGA